MLFQRLAQILSIQKSFLSISQGLFCLKKFKVFFIVIQNCHRASITNVGRKKYVKEYVAEVMKADGSIVYGRFKEPYHLVQLPLDLNSLSEDERRQILAARKPKAKKIEEDVIDDTFDSEEYEKIWKKD
uniref:39S ribosomal protein L55, mitochondrial n=1 Tax=Parastrongyloides trichosuri TaxID=131310 RepID=A0A0N4ZNS7_PARTI